MDISMSAKTLVATFLLAFQAHALQADHEVLGTENVNTRLYQDFSKLRDYSAKMMKIYKDDVASMNRFVTKFGIDIIGRPQERAFIGSYGSDQKFCYRFPFRSGSNLKLQCRPADQHVGVEAISHIPAHIEALDMTIEAILNGTQVGIGNYYRQVLAKQNLTNIASFQFQVENKKSNNEFPFVSLIAVVEETTKGFFSDKKISYICKETFHIESVQQENGLSYLALTSENLIAGVAGCMMKAESKWGAISDFFGFSELRTKDSYWQIKSD